MRSRFVMTAALVCAALSTAVDAQQFPSRPVRIVIGLDPVASTAAEYKAFLVRASKQMGEAARIAGIEPE